MKYIIITFEVLLMAILMLLTLYDIPKTGVGMVSTDVTESKERGVFVMSYTPSSKLFYLGEKQYHIDEIWCERWWYYINVFKEIKIEDFDSFYFSTIEPIDFVLNNHMSIEGEFVGYMHGKLTANIKCGFNDTLIFTDSQNNKILITPNN